MEPALIGPGNVYFSRQYGGQTKSCFADLTQGFGGTKAIP
jgi:hypothetical protein